MTKKIPEVKYKEIPTLIKVGKIDFSNKICFSFVDFKRESIYDDYFNSRYINSDDSRDAVADLFETFENICNGDSKQLFDPNNKRKLHLNRLKKPNVVEKINKILKEYYSFSENKIEQFENEYFEISFGNGKRVICYKADFIIVPLFLDPNHLVCEESSRNVKSKRLYQTKSIFEKTNHTYWSDNNENHELSDFISMVLAEVENGNIKNIGELTEVLTDAC